MKKSVIFIMALLLTGAIHEVSAATTAKEATSTTMQASPRGPHKSHAPRHSSRHIGTRLNKRPHHSTLIRFHNVPYYYKDGLFYKKIHKIYEAVSPEIGMVVPELPENGVSIINSKNGPRYVYDGVVYKEIPTKKGLKYEVVGFM